MDWQPGAYHPSWSGDGPYGPGPIWAHGAHHPLGAHGPHSGIVGQMGPSIPPLGAHGPDGPHGAQPW